MQVNGQRKWKSFELKSVNTNGFKFIQYNGSFVVTSFGDYPTFRIIRFGDLSY